MTVLEEAAVLIYGKRRQAYGHPAELHHKVALMWNAILGVESVTPRDVALCMAALKICREVMTRGKRDNIVDAVGYLGLVEELYEWEEKENTN